MITCKSTQTRSPKAVNKQLSFSVKKKPQTTDYYEGTVLTVFKLILSNAYRRREGWHCPEVWKI